MADRPPLRWRIVAKFLGGEMPKFLDVIWKHLDGIKTYLGLLVALVGFLVGWLPEVLAAAQLDPATIAKVVGLLTTVLGLLHRVVKGIQVYGDPAAK